MRQKTLPQFLCKSIAKGIIVNMKKYIMFVNNTSGIGGAQLYILRKANFLLAGGYEVYIITGKVGPIEFKEFKNLRLLEMKYIFLFTPNIFKKNKISKIMDTIANFIEYNVEDEVYIESHQVELALWAELFAARINSTNIIYAIAPFTIKRKIYNQFFIEKLNKNEFLGCTKSFIRTNFPNTKTNNNYINIPFDKGEIKILDCEKIADNIYDINILTISRIDKTYIKNSIIEIGKFARNNKTIKIKYDIYTNKTSGDKYKELFSIVKEYMSQNLVVNLNGPVNPLNNCIFENQDLFIGMGTSILNASSMKLPSLVVDYRNNKYYGFFGQDYFEFGTCDYFAEKELSYYIAYLIKNKNKKVDLGDKAYKLFMNEFENETVNEEFIKYMEEHSNKYIKKSKIPSGILDLRDLFDFITIRLFGIRISLKTKQLIIKIIHKSKNHI